MVTQRFFIILSSSAWLGCIFLLPSYPVLLCLIPGLIFLSLMQGKLPWSILGFTITTMSLAIFAGLMQTQPEKQQQIADIIHQTTPIIILSFVCAWFLKSFKAEEPAITQLARIIRQNDMPQKVIGYTNKLTIVWTGFLMCLIVWNLFILIQTLSSGLQPNYPINYNSLFVGCFFAIELVFRKCYLGRESSLRVFFKHIFSNRLWQQ